MQYLSKGRRVLVQGRLRQDSWEDKETGKRRSRIEVVASDVTFLDGPSGDTAGSTANISTKEEVVTEIDDKPIDLSEIPF